MFVAGNPRKSGEDEDIFSKMPFSKCTTCNICTCVHDNMCTKTTCVHCILLRQCVHCILQRQFMYLCTFYITKTTCAHSTCVQRQHVYITYE